MNDYTEVRLYPTPCNETITDVLAAMLADVGYESFVPENNSLTAYIRVNDFDAAVLDGIIRCMPIEDVRIEWNAETIEGRDWNAEWEKNYFQPIIVSDKCVIHSSFHKDIPRCEYDIVIDPKMAFGTGHHQTTSLIIKRLLDTPMPGKRVIDVGTGTGILAILAAMRGARHIDAIEIDEFAYLNAVENVAVNHHPEINVILGDASALKSLEPCDLLIANINRNIIVGDINAYAETIKPGGEAMFSGFYVEDIPVIEEAAIKAGLKLINHTERDNWASVSMRKSL